MLNEATLFCSGSLFLFCAYFCAKNTLRRCVSSELTEGDLSDMAVKCVSVLFGITFCIFGLIIISSVEDIINDRCWLTDMSVWLGLSYFSYDLWAMYQPFYIEQLATHRTTFMERMKKYMKSTPAMIFHHTVLVVLFLPCITLRNGKCDFFIGCFYLFELAVPFIALRNIIIRLKMKDTLIYVINGIVMIVVFFLVRVAIFPFMFWQYGRYHDISMWQVPLHIPKKCTMGCILLLCFMLYWFVYMVRVAARTIKKYFSTKTSHKSVDDMSDVQSNGFVKRMHVVGDTVMNKSYIQ